MLIYKKKLKIMPKFSKPNNCAICPYRSKYLVHLKNSDINEIQNNCLIVNFKKGENISKQGSDVTHALYLAKGQVKVFLEGKKKNIILKLVKEGQYIGLQSIFSDDRYKFSVSAVENSMVCMINKEYFLDIAKKNNDFLFEVTNHISSCTNYVYQKVLDFNQKQVRARLSETLIHFADVVFKSNTFNLGITRKELSELCSMSMENTVRLLSELKKEGIIEVEGRKITILQPEILKKLAEIG